MRGRAVLRLLLSAAVFVGTPRTFAAEPVSTWAEDRAAMLPTWEERLRDPIRLDCGATIVEAWGGQLDVPRLNALCTHAADNFDTFITAMGLERGR